MKKYAVVIESAEQPFRLSSDLPGCVTTGKTVEELSGNLREAIELHLEGVMEDGQPIPEPSTCVSYVGPRVA